MARKPSDINLLLGVDKPSGPTSHDVVARVRRQLGERRVGHAGTLDPLATGVMVVGVGQATRILGMLAGDRKRYVARIAFGCETTTDDAEGEPVRRAGADPALLDEEFAREALRGLMGPGMQVPPAYSAISVGGERSYRRARAGLEVELPARPIEVFEAGLLSVELDGDGAVWTAAFCVSKGTYIRALARDIGRACHNAAHLQALRRTASGGTALGDCLALDGLDRETARSNALDPVRLLGLEARALSERGLADALCGRPVARGEAARPCGPHPDGGQVEEGALVALVHAGELRALARLEGERFIMKDVFPQGIEGVR